MMRVLLLSGTALCLFGAYGQSLSQSAAVLTAGGLFVLAVIGALLRDA